MKDQDLGTHFGRCQPTCGNGARSPCEDRAPTAVLRVSAYLETRARSWTQPRGITLSHGDMPGLWQGIAFWRDSSGERSIIFSISIGCSSTNWSVRSFVDDEDGGRDQITRELWESPQFKATTLKELVLSLEKSLHALTLSLDQQPVQEYLASIDRRA